MIRDSLGDRMKRNYETPYRIVLPRRMPVIIRVDGKNFHTFLRGADKPFDAAVTLAMHNVAFQLLFKLAGAVFAYQQSDEVSVLLHNYKKFDTQPWFDNEVQKMVSVAASEASVGFNAQYNIRPSAIFDARVFVLPESEVANYFIWRQKDAERNSLSMLAQSHFSAKELHQKKAADMHEMLHTKDVNWNDVPTYWKRGYAVYRQNEEIIMDKDIPIFAQNRVFIEDLLKVEEE